MTPQSTRDIDLSGWEKDGFVMLPKFLSEDEIDSIRSTVDAAWTQFADRLWVWDLTISKRRRMREVPDEDRTHHRFKYNDLYFHSDAIRRIGLKRTLLPILTQLLGRTPALIGSMNMTHGTGQGYHVDSLYAVPHTPGHLLAVWVALENMHADSGLLQFFPGTHRIPAYKFSNGSISAVSAEMDHWRSYFYGEIDRRGIQRRGFLGERGDVIIWHGNLLHGGGPIADLNLSRHSCVFHYYSESDCRAQNFDLSEDDGSFWLNLPPDHIERAG
jgi:phytanoyl-CoA hydroxylase